MQNYTSLAHKLGWDDMQSHITNPALDRIITNAISHICDCTGDILCKESVVDSLLADSWTSDSVFSLLASPDYMEWIQIEPEFISLRGEIEDYMRKGYTHEQAIAEWYK